MFHKGVKLFKRKSGEKRAGRHTFAAEEFVRMMKCWLFCLILCMASGVTTRAQVWNREDSIRLANILSGKDTLRLNPEFQRAIQRGTFINTDPVGKMRESKSRMPIIKDFSEYIRPDEKALFDSRSPIRIPQMPPQAAMHQPEAKQKDELRLNPRAFTMPNAVKQAPVEGISTDFNHFLSSLFSKKYRRQMKNRKRAAGWKYNDLPSQTVYQKQKAFREAHPELVLRPDSVKPQATPESPLPDGPRTSDGKPPVR